MAHAEPNQKTAVIPAERDREALPDDSSHGTSEAQHSQLQNDVRRAKTGSQPHAEHLAHGHSSGHSNGTEDGCVVKGGKPAANGHGHGRANGVAEDVEKGADGDGKPADRGMVLPFSPVTVTFRDLHYFVPLPEVGSLIDWRRALPVSAWSMQHHSDVASLLDMRACSLPSPARARYWLRTLLTGRHCYAREPTAGFEAYLWHI